MPLFQHPDYSTRIAGGKYIGRHCFGDYTAGSYYTAVTNSNSWANHRTAPNPYIFANNYGLCIFNTGRSFFMAQGVGGRINLHIGSKKRPAANQYRGHVQNNT